MSVGVAYGSLIAFASYNRFHNPFVSDAFCLSALNSFTSLVTGIIAFAALGHTAVTYNEPIKQTANDGKYQVTRNDIVSGSSAQSFSKLMRNCLI